MIRRKKFPIRNFNNMDGNNNKQIGTSKNNNDKGLNDDRSMDQMETTSPVETGEKKEQAKAKRNMKDKGKMVDLNETNVTEMENENTELNLMHCVERMAKEDNLCGSTTKGTSGGFEVSARKKMNWKRRARLSLDN